MISKHQVLTMLLLLALLVPAAAQHISLQLEHALDGARFTPAGRISGNLEVDEVHRLLVQLTLRLASLSKRTCVFVALHLALHNKRRLLQLVLDTRLARRSGPVCCLSLCSKHIHTVCFATGRRPGSAGAAARRPQRVRGGCICQGCGGQRVRPDAHRSSLCCSRWLLTASLLGRMYLLRAVLGGAAAPPLLTSLPARCLATPGFRERLQVRYLTLRAAKHWLEGCAAGGS